MEPWVDWIVRTTGLVEAHLAKLGIDDWVTAIRRKKWRGPATWQDDFMKDGLRNCYRGSQCTDNTTLADLVGDGMLQRRKGTI